MNSLRTKAAILIAEGLRTMNIEGRSLFDLEKLNRNEREILGVLLGHRGWLSRSSLAAVVPSIGMRTLDRTLRHLEARDLSVRLRTDDGGALFAFGSYGHADGVESLRDKPTKGQRVQVVYPSLDSQR